MSIDLVQQDSSGANRCGVGVEKYRQPRLVRQKLHRERRLTGAVRAGDDDDFFHPIGFGFRSSPRFTYTTRASVTVTRLFGLPVRIASTVTFVVIDVVPMRSVSVQKL